MKKQTILLQFAYQSKSLRRVEAVQALENVDRSTLLKELIEERLTYKLILGLYQKKNRLDATADGQNFGYFSS